MHGNTEDEENVPYVPPPLTDDESNEDPDHILAVDPDENPDNETTFRIPVWLRESSKSFHWRWVPLPLRKAGRATAGWVEGPIPPRDLLFKPLFPRVQELPIKYLDRFFPKRPQRILLLTIIYVVWFLSWFLVLFKSASSGNIEGYGRPSLISCTASYWSPGNGCGLNGNDCRPFVNAAFAFRCPASCTHTIILDERTVGNQTLNYQPFVIGGPTSNATESAIYRADSFICQAAIHAGVVSDDTGGCGVVRLEGAAHSFPSVAQNGLTSVGFPSTFPKSFGFLKLPSSKASCPADPRWPLLWITVAAVVLVSLFTTSPAVFFFTTYFMLFFHVAMVSDPPNVPRLTDLFSILLSRLLPGTFIIYVLYLYAALPLLKRVAAPQYQLSKTILYLTPAFIGALNNYTFALWIPLQRLTPHDLNQPGAKTALAVVVIIIVCIVLSQAWYIRLAGLMPRYLAVYLSFIASLLILLALPGLRLRIHHYILAILLIPGTLIPTRPSLIYQGLLLGLFVNGVARWGFASIVETPAALGEDPSGPGGWWGAHHPNITNSSVTVHLPEVPQLQVHKYRGNGNITFHLWERERMENLGVEGVSILINDVERYRAYLDEDRKGKFTWHRHGHRGLELFSKAESFSSLANDTYSIRKTDEDKEEEEEPEDLFFRFAFLRGAEAGRYGPVGVWDKNGTWIAPDRWK